MRLNLGCGRFPLEGFVNVDAREVEGVDVVLDLDAPWPWEDGAASFIRASHVLEHVQDVVHVMAEARRVLRRGGLLYVVAPHYQHQNAWTDPTHRRAFTPDSMEFWTGNPDYEQYGPRFNRLARWRHGGQGEELRYILEAP